MYGLWQTKNQDKTHISRWYLYKYKNKNLFWLEVKILTIGFCVNDNKMNNYKTTSRKKTLNDIGNKSSFNRKINLNFLFLNSIKNRKYLKYKNLKQQF